VVDEIDSGVVEKLEDKHTILVGAQGWLRAVDACGHVGAALPEQLLNMHRVHLVCLSQDDHPNAEHLAAKLSQRHVVVVLTRGAQGATLFTEQGATVFDVPAPAAKEVDATGAGDVFCLIMGLALYEGMSPKEAACRAARAGALVAEGPGLGALTPATCQR